MKINIIYDSGPRVTSSWCLEQGFVNAADNCGYLNYAYNINTTEEINLEEIAKYPTIVPTGSLPKFHKILSKVKGLTKLILIETESIVSSEGIVYPYSKMMDAASSFFDIIYTHCYEDTFNYFGRTVNWVPGFINVEMFYPLDLTEKPKQKILATGYKNKYRDWLFSKDPEEIYIAKRKTVPSLIARGNTERLNRLIYGYDYYLSARSVFRGINGKVFQGLACERLVFVQNSPYEHKELFKDKEHVVYFDNFDHLIELYSFYQGNRDKYREICRNGLELIRNQYRTEHFVERIVRELSPVEAIV